jgi:hypothetical protein
MTATANETSTANHGIPRVTVLHGCTSAETAHVTEDYPYGRRLRCKRREWLEYKPKQGYRFVTQTTDPRQAGQVWNKPHASTYSAWAILVQSEARDGEDFERIGTMSAGYSGIGPAYHVRFTLSGARDQLSPDQAKMYAVLLRFNRERANVTGWERWRETIALMAANRGADGEPPSFEVMRQDSRYPYLPEHEYAAARAAVLTGFDADA